MSKIAICITGGHYLDWFSGHFYQWLKSFCNENKNYDPYIISWKTETNVPEIIRNSFQGSIYYRENEGLDWGCYNYFYNMMKDSGKINDYDYFLFLHDDILIRDFNWANFVITHLENNPGIDWSSTYGQYCVNKYDESIIRKSANMKIDGKDYFKSFIACFFACRVNQTLKDNCPFVCIPGDNRARQWRGTDPGDISAGICLTNVLNVWGPEKIGWTSTDGNLSNPNFESSVLGGKRGKSLRVSGVPNLSESDLTNFTIDEALARGFSFQPGSLASHDLLNSKSIIVGD